MAHQYKFDSMYEDATNTELYWNDDDSIEIMITSVRHSVNEVDDRLRMLYELVKYCRKYGCLSITLTRKT